VEIKELAIGLLCTDFKFWSFIQ